MIPRRLKLTENEAEMRYANWAKMFVDMVKPTNLIFVGGRGTAKSTDILAERTLDVIYDTPRAPLSFISDTYVNLMTNIIPFVMVGWERKKFFENVHFVVDKAPPPHLNFARPAIPGTEFKHTISVHNGCKFFLKSLDRSSMNAGISVAHIFTDEVKYAAEAKMNKAFPTLRGDTLMYKHSHFYMGYSLCSDMPDPNVGDHDWFLKLEENMDKNIILKILQTAFTHNDILIELINAKKNNLPERDIKNIERNLERWTDRLRKIRRDSTLFYEVSSFANADILTFQYFVNLFETLDIREFKTSVCSIRVSLEKGSMFYGNFYDKHTYGDGYNYDYYDQFGLRDNVSQTSAGLKYIRHDQPLEAGYDAGNMMSLVIGQEQGSKYRILKNQYILSPEWIRELADLFINFFAPHKHKILYLYYDRAANTYKKQKQDFAGKLKDNIEKDITGKPTGWHVKLMSEGQGNIFQATEYDLMNDWLSGKNDKLPELLIDKYECKELVSSIKLAPMTKDTKGRIVKVKKSEQLAIKRLPMESTNMSDAMKYLLCRKKFLSLVKPKNKISVGSVDVRG